MKINDKKPLKRIKELYDTMCNNVDWTYCYMIMIIIIGYVLLHDILGETLLIHNNWDSYTLQAKAWLDGHIYFFHNYDYLEIAAYKNHYYVSFPPLPSVFMLPWVMIYGVNTPNNIIMIIYIIIAVTLVYKIARFMKMREVLAAFWAFVTVFGCNMVWMSTMGGVWFQAQLLNMIFCFAAIYAMLNNKRVISYLCIAFAVGCRPFSIVYFFVLLIYYYSIDKKTVNKNSDKISNEENKKGKVSSNKKAIINIVNTLSIVLKQWKGMVSAALVGIVYMIYNYARFDDPLEFGHNYLPEFLEASSGQFNLEYVATNLYRIFIEGVKFNKKMGLEFTQFNGFIIFIANPIFLIYLVYIIKNIVKKNNNEVTRMIELMTVCNMILLCFHKTMGGWQFGNRYLVDLIPFILFYILFTKKREKRINKVAHWERFVGAFAILFNIYGAIIMTIIDLNKKLNWIR